MSVDVIGVQTEEGSVERINLLGSSIIGSTAKMHLYKASFGPVRGSVEADFVAAEADFDGYAPIVLVYSAAGVDVNGEAVALSNRAFFQATGATHPNSIGGCWVSYTNVNDFSHVFFPFASPVSMTDALDILALVHALVEPTGGGYVVLDT